MKSPNMEEEWARIRNAFKYDFSSPKDEEIAKTAFYLGAARSMKFLTEDVPKQKNPFLAILEIKKYSDQLNDFMSDKLYDLTGLKKTVEELLNNK